MNETEKDREIKDKDKANLVLLKVQKLSSALYLVSAFISDQDPLKWRLRDAALTALSETQSGLFERASVTIGQILSLIAVALSNPGVSQMNFSLLRREYELVRAELVPRLSLSEVSALAPLSPARASALSFTPSPKISLGQNPSSRQEAIIKYLKSQGPSSIKDIARLLPQVSSKTVQRELVELVASGRLQREGDRRWSRYALAD